MYDLETENAGMREQLEHYQYWDNEYAGLAELVQRNEAMAAENAQNAAELRALRVQFAQQNHGSSHAEAVRRERERPVAFEIGSLETEMEWSARDKLMASCIQADVAESRES